MSKEREPLSFRGRASYYELEEGEEAPFHKVFTYHWRHVPTGTTGRKRVAWVGTEVVYLEMLSYWNYQQPGIWEYAPVLPG